MAETAISCPYRPLGPLTVFSTCLSWIALCVFGLFKAFELWSGGLGAMVTASIGGFAFLFIIILAFLSALLVAWLPFQVLSAYHEGSLLTANEDGLTLPGGYAGLGIPVLIRWNEVSAVNFIPDNGRGLLELILHDKRREIISLAALGATAERLIVALEVWATNAEWTPSAVGKRDELQNASVGLDSFTRIWDDELNQRFSSTNFVPLEPGTQLQHGAYTVVRQMAFGGFSAVYLANDSQGNKVVLKEALFSNQIETQNKELELFQREAKLLAQLNHEQIARIQDQFVESQRHYLVIQHIDGDNLRDLVRRKGTVSQSTVRLWAVEMAQILDYLHQQSPPVVHRDFTPENLLLDRDERLCLIDFGAANEFIERATGTFIGKQCYMPPEQVRGKTEPASDFYSLGCTLYFLLTGKDPEPLSTCSPRALNSSISADLDQLVQRLTSMEPGSRPKSSREIEEALTASTTLDISSLSRRRHEVT